MILIFKIKNFVFIIYFLLNRVSSRNKKKKKFKTAKYFKKEKIQKSIIFNSCWEC